MTLGAGLRAYLRSWQRHVEEDAGATHSPEEHAEIKRRVGELIWRLERATARPGSRIQHSDEAIRPAGVEAPPDIDPEEWPQPPSPPRDGHSFSVERQLPDGRWVEGWTRATQQTTAWRGMCSCGWRGGDITGDSSSGQEDDASRERVYDWWNEHHVPDFEKHSGP